ncbi:MAG: hypothetical protein A2Y23_03460 [Clostridiales bacterium GWB2_37_7]|nr:MAG: hypothetical protein A2Y23_03460 [Clostridiales bacterium GWB2_37_7]
MNYELKPYEKYKSTDTSYMDMIPIDWDVIKLREVFQERKEKNINHKTENVLSVMKDIGVIPYSEKGNVGNKCSEDIERYKLVYPNDIVMNCMNVIIGSVGMSKYYGALSPVYYVLKNRNDEMYDIRYFDYVFKLKSLQRELTKYGKGILAHRMRIPMEMLKNLLLPYPSSAEQEQIVIFLDSQLAKINKLIKAKKKIIVALKEQKQAVINEAVTKGINPDIKLKPSGIEWLEDIPEHWKVSRIKAVANIRYGLSQPPKEAVNGLPMIRATNVDSGKIIEKDLIFIDKDDLPLGKKIYLKKDEIIIVRSGAYTADSAIIPEKYDGAIAGYDMVITVKSAIAAYISYVLLSKYVLNDQLFLVKMRAAQPHLNAEEVGNAIVVLPPIEEQKKVVRILDIKCKEIDMTKKSIQKEIDLITEYRTRLISDAVTGKIDVRGIKVSNDQIYEEEYEYGEDIDEIDEIIDEGEVNDGSDEY